MEMSLYATAVSIADVTPDGRLLVSSSEDGRIARVSSCRGCGSLETVLDEAHSRPARQLTPDEQKRYLPDGE